ncbi:MAG: hypothetical protein CVV33_01455 [Methanomicrobiales archaeon HGW-Methanomicrobiales-4]|nr:MAG: hypothetical protein CVV33_01455 [Methanomicrobiales archaeon HGW-Methanomicrobiales-4]
MLDDENYKKTLEACEESGISGIFILTGVNNAWISVGKPVFSAEQISDLDFIGITGYIYPEASLLSP